MISEFKPAWSDEIIEGTIFEFRQQLFKDIPAIKQWVLESQHEDLSDADARTEYRRRHRIWRACRWLRDYKTIPDCQAFLWRRGNKAIILFKHSTDDHSITEVAEIIIRKCELCNGQLSPKGRPHNCPGDVMWAAKRVSSNLQLALSRRTGKRKSNVVIS